MYCHCHTQPAQLNSVNRHALNLTKKNIYYNNNKIKQLPLPSATEMFSAHLNTNANRRMTLKTSIFINKTDR